MRRATPSSLMRKPNSRGKGDIVGRDVLDAFHRHRGQIGRGAEGQAGEQRQLVRGVAAADIQRGIGFGIAQRLRFLQHIGEGAARSLPSR